MKKVYIFVAVLLFMLGSNTFAEEVRLFGRVHLKQMKVAMLEYEQLQQQAMRLGIPKNQTHNLFRYYPLPDNAPRNLRRDILRSYEVNIHLLSVYWLTTGDPEPLMRALKDGKARGDFQRPYQLMCEHLQAYASHQTHEMFLAYLPKTIKTLRHPLMSRPGYYVINTWFHFANGYRPSVSSYYKPLELRWNSEEVCAVVHEAFMDWHDLYRDDFTWDENTQSYRILDWPSIVDPYRDILDQEAEGMDEYLFYPM